MSKRLDAPQVIWELWRRDKSLAPDKNHVSGQSINKFKNELKYYHKHAQIIF
jgi:hypothetical protein